LHIGYYPKHTTGCSLPGKTAGKDSVGESDKAMAEILGIIDFARTVDKALGQPTDIVVRVR
jgi:hypothetical protein